MPGFFGNANGLIRMHQTDRDQLRFAVAGLGRQREVVVRFAGFAEIFVFDAHGQVLHDVVTGADAEGERGPAVGAGIVGVNAGELLAETVLAMEMGADLEDLALTVHAHPTLSETPMFAAEMGLGSITDLYVPKK